MKKKNTLALVLAMLLVVSAASIADTVAPDALPSDIKWSEDMQTVYSAWAAVREAYDMTRYDLSLFYYEQSSEAGEVRFIPITGLYADALGEYTATKNANGEFTATWSHDADADREMLAKSDLSSPIWGAVQAKQLIDMETEHSLAYAEMIREMDEKGHSDIAKAAAVDQIYTDAGYIPWAVAVEPSIADLSPDEARAKAVESISDTYGIAPEDFKPTHEQIWLDAFLQEGTRQYTFTFILEKAERYESYGYGYGYHVQLDASTGEVTSLSMSGSNPTPSLPKGPLKEHWHAVQAFISYDGMNKLPHADRPDAARRIRESGHADQYNLPDYLVPDEKTLPEEEAVAAAALALEETYGIKADVLHLFDKKPSYVKQAGKPVWDIELLVSEGAHRRLPYDVPSAIGYYRVILDGITGELLDAMWSFDHAAGSGSLTHVNVINAEDSASQGWVALEILDPSFLPQVAAFVKSSEAIGDRELMTAEANAAYAELYREAGGTDNYYDNATLPQGDHVQFDEAFGIAIRALAAFYDITPEMSAKAKCRSYFFDDEDGAKWDITLNNTAEGAHEFSRIVIDAETGEVLEIDVAFRGNG